MTDILRDPIWQFAGAALALIAILLSVYFYRLQQKRKSLAYEIVSSTSLLNIKNEAKEQVKILMGNKSIPGLHLLVVRLSNSGDLPIPASDYEMPISFSFNNNEILDAAITSTLPKNVKASIEVDQNEVRLIPILLNPKDAVEFKVLLTQYSGQINVGGRVIGVSQIKLVGDVPNYDLVFSIMAWATYMGILAILCGLLVFVLSKLAPLNTNQIAVVAVLYALLLGLLLNSLSLWFFYLSEKKKFRRWTQSSS